MKLAPALDPLRSRSRFAAEACRRFATHPLCLQLALRLDQIADTSLGEERPVVAALLGGTGVGKSHLFNALIGRSEASPTSADKRLKTEHPIVARRPADQALMPDFGDAETRFIDAPLNWFALVDTPDVDGARPAHWETALRVVEQADLIVYVASPEKRADKAVLDRVREWAPRKRWFFVQNMADKYPGIAEQIRADFDEHLRAVGFTPDDTCRFLVSAAQPEGWDFSRLRHTLLSERSRAASNALAIDAVLGQIQHATDPAALATLLALSGQLANRRDELTRTLAERLKEVITNRQLDRKLMPILRQQLWGALPSRVGGPVALPVALHARFSAVASAFQLWRLTTAGFSLWRVGLLLAGLAHSLRGNLELRGVITQLEAELASDLERLDHETRLFLEDRQLVLPPETPAASTEDDLRQLAAAVPVAGEPLARLLGNLLGQGSTSRVAREVAPLLSEAVARRAEEGAGRAVSWVARFCNIFPIAALGHTAWELVTCWMERAWLPGIFYLHALAIFALALLPGYLLVYLGALRQLRRTETLATLLDAAEHLRPCGPAAAVALVAQQLTDLLAELYTLRRQAENSRAAIEAEFGRATLGATLPPRTH